MKKIYFLALAFIFTGAVQAQSLTKPSPRFKLSKEEVLNQRKARGGSALERSNSFYMDHSTANYDDDFFVWNVNSNYVSADTAINYVGLSLNKIFGYTDAADPSGTLCDSSTFGFSSPYPGNIGIRVDSIFAQITHENNSGNYDKIRMQIVGLTSAGAPGNQAGVAANVFWEQVDSTNVSLSSNGNWLGTGAAYILSYAPYPTFIGASAFYRLGLVFRYEDATKQDSLGILAGYVKDPLDATKALQSTIQTSWIKYPPFRTNLTKNSSITYVNGGYFTAQNWGMWAYVTVGTDVDGFNENSANGFRVLESYPNPSNEVTSVRYELGVPSEVNVTITDITGKVVFNHSNSHQSAGEYKINLDTEHLSNGIYTYTLNANKASISKRFVVQH